MTAVCIAKFTQAIEELFCSFTVTTKWPALDFQEFVFVPESMQFHHLLATGM